VLVLAETIAFSIWSGFKHPIIATNKEQTKAKEEVTGWKSRDLAQVLADDQDLGHGI